MKKNSQIFGQGTKNNIKVILTIISIALPLIIIILSLWKGFFTLWYDPARDLLSAWSNLHKFSFIGPPAGIPGLFYGPYWLWLLSLGMIFSKNPLIITFIVASIPYVVVFPYVWFKFRTLFGYSATILGWVLFIFANGITYATQLWNPYPAPLITLGVIYLLYNLSFESKKQKNNLLCLVIGFLSGLVINFHISYGIALTLGVFVFMITETIKPLFYKTKTLRRVSIDSIFNLFSVGIGIVISFIPTLIFESRHGFHQIQTLLHTLFQFGNVVSVRGLSKNEIALEFIKTFERILHVSSPYGYILILLFIGLFSYLLITKKIGLSKTDNKLLQIIFSILGSVIFIFFTAKNPIWNYHFIGVDLLFILLITFFISKIKLMKFAFSAWILIIIFLTYQHYYIKASETSKSEYFMKKQVVLTIAKDAKNNEYTVYPYNAAIYTYDYAYLFLWLVNKNVPYDPGQNKDHALVYLIIPKDTNDRIEDFIEFRGSNKEYKIVNHWNIGENTILKKQRINKS